MDLSPQPGGFVRLSGTAYRAVSPADPAPLAGSSVPGRWGAKDVLYLSASPEGVSAAMRAHGGTEGRQLRAFAVEAAPVADLRDAAAMARLGVDPRAGACDWQAALARGARPASWGVAEALIAAGAVGVIDPSRKAPGLWHLALFRWGREGHAEAGVSVAPLGDPPLA